MAADETGVAEEAREAETRRGAGEAPEAAEAREAEGAEDFAVCRVDTMMKPNEKKKGRCLELEASR